MPEKKLKPERKEAPVKFSSTVYFAATVVIIRESARSRGITKDRNVANIATRRWQEYHIAKKKGRRS